MDKEQFLIQQFQSKYIGDDGAVVFNKTGDTVYSMDAFHEDTHFKREWMSYAQIGRKAMLVNISDAIAMNARPKYALVTVSLPKDMSEDEISELRMSLEDTAAEYGCEIIGGDTVGGDKLHLSITIISETRAALYRSGLCEGDLLAYTGILGESKRDLDRLFAGETIVKESRFYTPILRQEFIQEAREFLRSGMDISDGLYCDTNKLLEYNNLGFDIITPISDEIGLSGEEYEMLVGFEPQNLEMLLKIAQDTDTKLTIFAKVAVNSNRFQCASHHF